MDAGAVRVGQTEAEMRDHFAYLLDEESADFFQKLACDDASSQLTADKVVTPAMVKTASASVTPFEKVAARLDRDLYILKEAGPCGINAGMQKRANAYVDVLLDQVEMSPDEFSHVFEKIAVEAIQVDLEAAYYQLCSDLPESEHHLVDEVLIKTGHELTRLALMEKEAVIGAALSRFVPWVARGLGRLVGGGSTAARTSAALSGAGTAAKGLLSRAGGAVSRATAGETAAGLRASRAARLTTAAKDVSSLQKKVMTLKPGTIGHDAARGMLAKREAQLLEQGRKAAPGMTMPSKAVPGVSKETAGLRAAPAHKPPTQPTTAPGAPPGTTAPKPTEAPAPAITGAKKSEQAAGDQAKASDDAAKAATPPKPKDPELGPAGGPGTPPPPGGAEGKPPGFMDAWKKATSQGWGALGPAEKGALVRGGVNAALVYRVVTGKGAVTGGEGVI